MKSKVFKRILSAILSIQMICAFTPAIVLNANAEELQMYLNEDFTSENNKWTGKTYGNLKRRGNSVYALYSSRHRTKDYTKG